MFEISSRPDPRLQDLANGIEDEEIGLRVTSAQVYNLPYIDLEVNVEVCKAQPFNILEEFILRAAHTLQPPPTLDALTAMMGIDRLFLDASWQKLVKLNAVDTTDGQRMRLTENGRTYYLQGQLPPDSRLETLSLRYQPITRQLAVTDAGPEESESAPLLPGYLVEQEPSPEEVSRAIADDLDQIIAAAKHAGLELHAPEDGQVIRSVRDWSITAQGQISRAVLVVQDTVAPGESEDNVSLRVLAPMSGRRDFSVETILGAWLDEGRVKLANLLPRSTETIPQPEEAEDPLVQPVLARPAINHYRTQMTTLRGQPSGDKSPPTPEDRQRIGVQLLRDEEIRPSFLAALRSARHTVLIYSPWISDEVIDDEFIAILEEIAQRQVITLIGWGIARTQDKQARRPPESLIQRLHQIKTPEGCPAVIVHWVGNQHSKDVLVDYSLHMSGSHNWLSYRGDRFPRGESTYRVTEPGCVEAALGYMEKMFAKAVDERWQSLVSKKGRLLRPGGNANTLMELMQCCVTAVVTRQPKVAIRRVRNLPDTDANTPLRALRLMSTIDLALLRLPDELLSKTMALSDLENAAAQLRQNAISRPGTLDQELQRFEKVHGKLTARLLSTQQPSAAGYEAPEEPANGG